MPCNTRRSFQFAQPFPGEVKYIVSSLNIFLRCKVGGVGPGSFLFSQPKVKYVSRHPVCNNIRTQDHFCLVNLFPGEVIFLEHNNLTNLDSVLHPGMYNADVLELSHNPFTRVTENSFNGKVNNARYINMDNCLIQEFNIRHYTELHELFKLDLNYNLIDKIINLYEANHTDDYIKEFNSKSIYIIEYFCCRFQHLHLKSEAFYDQIFSFVANLALFRIYYG
ncbi:hypothetical protein CEXT_325081 [Caerostris extrusa]|uniref:Uncharacterized protein n=1 Tax=Caerostris extrusa TaxID=172846 RepID=A0AAV4PXT8_CAEEX|nr:hypothetical protein CEXT_325081 [Caerostris extrusa]